MIVNRAALLYAPVPVVEVWSTKYIGVPYVDGGRTMAGLDCYGVLWKSYKGELGIVLPDGRGIAASNAELFGEIIHQNIEAGNWTEAFEPKEFDVALFRRGPHDSHVGVMVDQDRMLHGDALATVVRIESVSSSRWATNFAGFYRHRDMI